MCVEVHGRLNRCTKKGNFSAMSLTEFELTPMQNDRVRVDFGSGRTESGPKVARHLKWCIQKCSRTHECDQPINASIHHGKHGTGILWRRAGEGQSVAVLFFWVAAKQTH